MAYLFPAEYAAFGLSTETVDAWVTAASAMIDAHCRRASLLSATYTERLPVRHDHTVVLSYGPITSVTSIRARYAQSTGHGDGFVPFEEFIANAFSLPGSWVDLDPATIAIDRNEILLSGSLLQMRFREAEITYVAGEESVPDPVKVACAQIVRNAQTTPGLNVRSTRMDTLQTEYFSDALLDTQVRALLRPYVAERLA
ncbi:MAG: hypothetical protein PW735_09115 [Acidobacteriaceae bacterium]|nr:hypothetical protein [Acidobacteriaceae bacterium]